MRVLLCSPEYFDIRYEINPWMDVNNNAESSKAMQQWRNMIDALAHTNAKIEHIRPHEDFPDMVFTANAGLVRHHQVILSNFKHEERRGERDLFELWFLRHGYQTLDLPSGIHFEGEGDALFFKDLLFMGHGFRTDKESHQLIADMLNVDYVSLELINPKFYHLDTCLFVSDNHICFYKDAFTPESLNMALTKLTQYVAENELSVKITSVSSKHAESFICNSIAIKDKVITPASDFSGVFDRAAVCDMSEFMKSGGAIKCLTLKL